MNYYTTTTEYNCGIDLHARQMYMCLMDRQGNKLVHTNIQGNDFAYFLTKVAPFKHDLTVVSECTFNWFWLPGRVNYHHFWHLNRFRSLNWGFRHSFRNWRFGVLHAGFLSD